MAQAPTTSKRTNCPNCGAKLPEQPLSLCSYCAMPLDLAEGVDKRESQNSARILKVREGKGFEAAMAAAPPESARWMQGWKQRYQGKTLLVLAALSLLLGLIVAEGAWWTAPTAWLAYALIAFGAVKLVRGAGHMRAATEAQLLKRPALILDRRSETTLHGWGGDTRYYFTLEFEDGGVAEFGMDGRGTGEEPFPNGMFGVAYSRGTELLDFKQVRV